MKRTLLLALPRAMAGILVFMLAAGRTDADGRIVLEGARSTGDLAVKALGPGHVPRLRSGSAPVPRWHKP